MQCSTSPIATRSARACHQRALLPARNSRITAPRCSASQKDTKAEIVNSDVTSAVLRSSALLSPFLFHVQSALATGGEYGLLEGRTAALVHPAIMFSLLASTGYAGYLGWQWRRAREIGEEIRELKKSQPAPAADGAVTVSFDGGSAVVDQIVAKEKERKELIAGNFKDKHFWWGSLILASGTGIAIEGCVNTYMRTGKLFPGPHLFAGAGMVAIWALAAALVPEMQKGNNNARSAHIALNAVNFLLFASQVPTGLEIVGKVFQFTQWP